MLKAPKFKELDARMVEFLRITGGRFDSPKEIQPGLYEIAHFSFNEFLDDSWEEWPEVGKVRHRAVGGEYSSHGVCDSPAQFLKHGIGRFITKSKREFCVSFTHIEKKADPEGGWRWHKWGPYIGKGKPTTEYIYDEAEFDDGVYVYAVFEKKQ